MGQVYKFFKDFFIYGLGASAQIVVGLISLPILTKVFDPSKYGVIDLSNSFIEIFGTIFAFGLTTATAFYFFQSKNTYNQAVTVSTGTFFLVVVNALILIISFIFAPFFSKIFFNSDNYEIIFKITVIIGASSILYSHLLYLLRIAQRPWQYTANSVFKIVLDLACILIFVLALRLGVQGYFLGIVVSTLIATFVVVYQNRKLFVFSFSSKILFGLLKYGIPLLPAGIAIWALQLINRYFLVHYATLYDVGVYGVAVRSTILMLLLITSLKLAWIPFAFSIMKQHNAKEIFSFIYKYFVIIAVGFALATSLFAREGIRLITTPEYESAYFITPILCAGALMYALFNIVSIGIIINKKTILQSVCIGAGACINIILNFMLIPRFGMTGAAVSTLISYGVAMIMAQIISHRYYPIQFKYYYLLVTLIIAATLLIIGLSIPWDNNILIIVLKLALLLLYPILLVGLKIITRHERTQMNEILKQFIHHAPIHNKI